MVLISLKVKGETIDAQFLNVMRRPSSNRYFDYFYSCNSCGRGIQWEVNGESAATHTVTDDIGSVAYETEHNDSSALRYTSILLGKRSKNDSVCMDALLIVTRTELHLIQVICRGTSQQIIINYQLPDLTVNIPLSENNVKLNFIIGQQGVISSNSNIVTQVLMCTTRETSQLWERDQQLAGAFNGVDNAGSSYYESHSLDSSVVSREAILLVKRRNVEITSVLVISELNSTHNFTVSCLSDSDFASINLLSRNASSKPASTSSSPASTFSNSTSAMSDSNISSTISVGENNVPSVVSQAQPLHSRKVSEVYIKKAK